MMSSVFHRLNCNEIIVDNLSPSHSRREGGRKMRFVMRRSHFLGGHSIRGLSWQTSSYHFSSTLPGAFVEQKQSWEYYTIMFSFNLLTKKPSKACELVSWEKMRIVMKQLFVKQSVVFVLFTSGHHQRRDKQQFAIYSPSIRWCQKTTLCHQRFWTQSPHIMMRRGLSHLRNSND